MQSSLGINDENNVFFAGLLLHHKFSRSAIIITKHLRILEDTGLITATRDGRETRYTYRPAALDTARTALDAIAGNWTAVTPPAKD